MKTQKCLMLLHNLVIVFLMLCTFCAMAATKQKAPDPKDLIGLEIVDGQYPDGWVWDGSRSGGVGSTYFVLQLKNKKQYAFIFLREKGNSRSVRKISGTITDAMSIIRPDGYHDYSWRCYHEKDKQATKSEDFTGWLSANVRFKNYCDMTTKHILKAWNYSDEPGKFRIIEDTKGMICEFGFGEDLYKRNKAIDFREKCKSYNFAPSRFN